MMAVSSFKHTLSLLVGLLIFPCLVHATPAWQEYHDYKPVDHTAKVANLIAQGYRPISLSVYGTYADHQYAAVWVQRPGPAFQELHDLDYAQLNISSVQLAKQGYQLTQIAAGGTAKQPVFAAVFEKIADGNGYDAHFGLHQATDGQNPPDDPNSIDYYLYKMRQFGNDKIPLLKDRPIEQTIISQAVYGSSGDPRFAIVIRNNPARLGWNSDLYPNNTLDSVSDYQHRFDAHSSQWHRPALTAVSQDGRFWGLFVDSQLPDFSARHGMNRTDLDAAIIAAKAKGQMPISVQGGGPVGGVTYTATFASSDIPLPRKFTVGPMAKPDQPTPQTDRVVRDFMVANGLRQAAVVATQDKRLVFAKGYNYAESNFPQVSPTTYFRTASLAKTLTAMAIEMILQRSHGALSVNTKVQDVLHWHQANGAQPLDSNFNSMTIGQLLTHTAGLGRKKYVEWTPSENEVAAALGKSLPVSAADVQSYLMSQTITDRAPGKSYEYSNVGYFLLSAIIEKVTGMGYFQYMQKEVAATVGATRIRSMATLVPPLDEARYFNATSGIVPTVMNADQHWVPYVNGGLSNLLLGAGALSVGPVDYIKMIAALNAPGKNLLLSPAGITDILNNGYGWDSLGNSGPATPFHGDKGGLLPGLQSMVNYTQGGLTYVVFWDRDGVNRGVDSWYPSFALLESALVAETKDPANDFFPSFQIPTF